MPAPTPGYVKNIVRRSLREIVDPSPSKKDEYKEGHMDHLVSSSVGGSNQISNRVLSCASCNEKEKLDMPWEQFFSPEVFR